MYLHLGSNAVTALSDIIGIFDIDNSSSSAITREFFKKAEGNGQVENISEDLPKSFVVTANGERHTVYLSQLASSTLRGRCETFVGWR